MSYNYNESYSIELTEDELSDLQELNTEVYEYDNDQEVYGGYGIHFDCYSNFDLDDYEYQQNLYY